MSVTESNSTNAASARLSRAISAAKPAGADGAPAVERVTRRPKGQTSPATRDAARGADAAPGGQGGADAAGEGAASVMGAGQPGSGPRRVAGTTPTNRPSHAPTPYEASMASYEAMGAQAGTAAEPRHAAAYEAALSQSQAAPEPMGVQGGGDSVAGSGAWTPRWQAHFEQLQLAPADIEYLAQAGYSDDELHEIAMALQQVDPLDPSAPQPGVDAGGVTSANGPTPEDAAAMAGGTAWTPEWAQKFGDVMERMGMSDAQVREQLATVEGQPVSQEQLQAAYEQMEASLGAFDDGWRDKFTRIMDELDTPADEQAQVLEQLAGGGLTESQLSEAYAQMENARPGWNAEWKNKFESLDVPEEMLKQIEESGAPASALEQQYDQLIETKMKYHRDGRLEKLEDAGANAEEKWGVMLQDTKGEEFDKVVEQIHSAHVPAWKRIGSFALNLVPGVYALQFVTGKDWVTGEKIDRSNPLNIVGAVASGFAGFTAVRSAVAGVQGLTAANAAAQATKTAAGGAALADAVTSTSALSQGSFKAIQAAGLVDKFDKGLKFTDYLKSAVPLVNRFGEAGRLSAVGRGYYQSMQLAAGMGAMRSLEGGRVAVDQATKGTILAELKQGRSISDAMAAAGRTSGTGGGYALRAQDVVRDASRYGFLQGGVGRLGEGNRLVRGSGNFNFNPFRSTATVAETATEGVFSLGRGVNFGRNAGLAQGIGLVRGANGVSNAGLYAAAANRAAGANQLMSGNNASRMAGVTIADDVQRIETMRKTADWARRLGVTDGGAFRSLGQLTGSGRAVRNVTGIVERGGSTGYRFGRHAMALGQRYANYAAVPLVGGAAIGMTGKQMQPYWEYLKNRKEIQAEEAAQREVADREAVELEQLYAEQQAARQGQGQAQPAPAAQPTTGIDPATAAANGLQVVGTSPSGGQLVYDPSLGLVVDDANGDLYDPATQQLVGNLLQQQQAATQPAATAPAPAAAATGQQQVYVDPATGYYVDPQSGLMADPVSGQVFDQQGNVVGNVNQPAA